VVLIIAGKDSLLIFMTQRRRGIKLMTVATNLAPEETLAALQRTDAERVRVIVTVILIVRLA